MAKKALDLGKAEFASDSENIVNLHYNLAESFTLNKKHMQAFRAMNPVIKGYKKLYGSSSEELFQAQIDQLNRLPKIKNRKHKVLIKEVKPLVVELIETGSALINKSTQKKAQLYYLLSKNLSQIPVVYITKGDAKQYTELAYEELFASKGPAFASTIELQLRLAGFEQSAGNNERAINLYENLLATSSANSKTTYPNAIAARQGLIEIYEESGQFDKSNEHCVAIGKKAPCKEYKNLEILSRKAPKYPASAARDKRQGWVNMSYNIDKKGSVKDIKVIESKGGKDFEKAAIAALKGWRYAPVVENGKAIVVKDLSMRLDFRLENN